MSLMDTIINILTRCSLQIICPLWAVFYLHIFQFNSFQPPFPWVNFAFMAFVCSIPLSFAISDNNPRNTGDYDSSVFFMCNLFGFFLFSMLITLSIDIDNSSLPFACYISAGIVWGYSVGKTYLWLILPRLQKMEEDGQTSYLDGNDYDIM